MQLVMGQNEIPPGAYQTVFNGVEQIKTDNYGDGLRWKFQIVDGEMSGAIASRVTSFSPTSKNACGRMLQSLTGKALTRGVAVDIDAYKGTRYTAVVSEGENGGTRVEAIVAAK